MKSSLFTLLLTVFCMAISTSQTIPTIREQLEGLNKYWVVSPCNSPILSERGYFKTDISLIRTHLTLVEKYLRLQKTNLSERQSQNRSICLDILKEYYERSVFPINTYHSERTPYFIDNFGTACAVGQLLISTGYEDLAKRISKEHNYEYIENLHYPELIAWADKYGFTLDELKWIQPAYGCVHPLCQNNSKRDVSCYGGSDGCIGYPTPTLSGSLFAYSWYKYNNLANQWQSIFQTCDLSVGAYKCVVVNGQGDTQDFIYNIEQPEPISISADTYSDNSSCNGSAVIQIAGGAPPYNVLWSHNNETSLSISGLCQGDYTIEVSDNNHCSKSYNVTINLVTGVTEHKDNTFSVFPNPSNDKITVMSRFTNGNNRLIATIYNSTGQVVATTRPTSSNFEMSIADFRDGIYWLSIDNGSQVTQRKFIKN